MRGVGREQSKHNWDGKGQGTLLPCRQPKDNPPWIAWKTGCYLQGTEGMTARKDPNLLRLLCPLFLSHLLIAVHTTGAQDGRSMACLPESGP